MNNGLRLILAILIFGSIVLSSWYVLHNDIHFHTDIARDFLLFSEITQKKIVLIGPRSSAAGLYHGPLWLYLNYPAYSIGHGNPVVVGWFWVILFITFLLTSFAIAKKLCGETSAWLYTLFLSVYFITDISGLYNPYGGLFLLPVFFFLFVRYVETKKCIYLIAHIIIAGCILQFQIAAGIPLTFLSFIAVLYIILKTRQYLHILSFAVLCLVLFNFILFDIRHSFILTHAGLHMISPASYNPKVSTMSVLLDRLRLLYNFEFIRNGSDLQNIIVSIAFILLLSLQMVQKKNRTINISFLYFYLGFVILSITSKNIVLTTQVLPLYSLVFFVFASLVHSKFKNIFLLIFSIVIVLNITGAINFIKNSRDFIGKNPESWNFLLGVSQKVYMLSNHTEFGYFVYSPDVLGYQPKYAMQYMGIVTHAHTFGFEKKQLTFIIAASPPPEKLYMTDDWWRIHQIRIVNKPKLVVSYSNGFKIEKYILTKEDIRIPYDPNSNPGLSFR